MLRLLGSKRRCCDKITRREALTAGALALGGGFSLPQLLNAENARRPGRARNVIMLYLLGGAATQDMVDMKPTAPSQVRGEFRPMATSVPGMHVCEHLPRMARWMHKIAVVRSLTHQAGCHNPLPSYTGYAQLLPDIVSTRDTYPPSMGSVCEFLRQTSNDRARRTRDLPDYVYMPCYLGWGQAIRRPGPYGGFLSQRHDPFFTECTPYAPAGTNPAAGRPATVLGAPRLPSSQLPAEVTLDRLNTRRSLVQQIDDQLSAGDGSTALDGYTRNQQRAFDLLTSSRTRAAFDLAREEPRVRERYGDTLFGNCALIARRMVESGVRFVNVTWDLFWDRIRVNYDSWDTHTNNFPILRDVNLPEFDRVYSALLDDLDQRGLLDETLVVVLSEMGRTPRINARGGRDHWTYCYGTWLAGGGIRGGTLCGESDAQAAYVKDRPVSPADLCCTIYDRLGIDPHTMVPDRTGRPVPVSQGGRVIHEILS